ncbi:MAG: hypothetical protein DMF61_19985 [Blastocatellia bacterium AA13]|nr:MAG: hypothetical protein DMF61_19985 [Blastocatellia bacterium AA13]
MTTRLAAFSLLLLVPHFSAQQRDGNTAQERQVRSHGMNITISLVRRNDRSEYKTLPNEPVNLEVESVAVGQRTIQEILTQNHIFPDVEAFGIVYALNPNREDLNLIKGLDILIPKVDGGAMLSNDFAKGYSVLLTLDKDLKTLFGVRIERFRASIATTSTLNPLRFLDSSVRTSLTESLRRISVRLGQIDDRIMGRYERPIPTTVLIQLSSEIQLLIDTLSDVNSSDRPIGKAILQQVDAVRNDVEIRADAFTYVAGGIVPRAWPKVAVVVKTLHSGVAVNNLRIYYAPEALKDKTEEAHSFAVLSSPAVQRLFEADYCFWAARDPKVIPISNVVCHEVRLQSPDAVDIELTVIQ